LGHVHTFSSFLYIDEAFADLTGMPGSLERLGREMRARVLRCTGIPVGVGIAQTKTLAKLANRAAKLWQRQTGGVVDIRQPEMRDRLLQVMDVSEVWGIGRQMTAHLRISVNVTERFTNT